jgi:hypothetical protein
VRLYAKAQFRHSNNAHLSEVKMEVVAKDFDDGSRIVKSMCSALGAIELHFVALLNASVADNSELRNWAQDLADARVGITRKYGTVKKYVLVGGF